MPVHTTLSGVPVNTGPKQQRNTHLLTEIQTRSKRIFKQASLETVTTFEAYPTVVQYFHWPKSGRECSCQSKAQERKQEAKKQQGLVWDDFVVSIVSGETVNNRCPLCFSSGIAGGFRRAGADLIMLDSTLPYTVSGIYKEDQRPAIFRPVVTWGEINWTVNLPRYAQEVVNCAIRWEEEPEEWEFLINGSAVTNTRIMGALGTEATFTLRMKDGYNLSAGLYGIFLYLKVSDIVIHCDLPLQKYDYGGSEFNRVNEPETGIQANFSSKVGEMSTKDLFVTEEGQAYRILSYEKGSPYDVNIYYTTTVRTVKKFETFLMVPSKVLEAEYNSKLYTFVL